MDFNVFVSFQQVVVEFNRPLVNQNEFMYALHFSNSLRSRKYITICRVSFSSNAILIFYEFCILLILAYSVSLQFSMQFTSVNCQLWTKLNLLEYSTFEFITHIIYFVHLRFIWKRWEVNFRLQRREMIGSFIVYI